MKKIFLLLCILAMFSCKTLNQKTYEIGYVETSFGKMYFWLYDETPLHKASFIELAKQHYWDPFSFNRVIKNFVVQGGCPDTPEGFSNSPYLIEPEFSPQIKHIYGAVGMGRDDNPKKMSAGCQFYIVHDVLGIARLDQNYTVFGQVFKGLDVLDKTARLPTDSLDAPLDRVSIKVRTLKLTKEELTALGGSSFLKNE
ncbi:MAG: peptidylprolyl isomerase [Flavobacteriales bacterium]|nr:peptidylprolyl isomerase [Candidatus Arcticimaribacter sp.]